jgi:prepilin-type processing-associated H-X9-DG protein
VEAMVQYLYHGNYSNYCYADTENQRTDTKEKDTLDRQSFLGLPRTPDSKGDQGGALLFNTKVYIIADKYDILELKKRATVKCKDILSERLVYNIFTKSAEILWDNTVESDSLLRDEIMKVAVRNISGLLQNHNSRGFLATHNDFCLKALDGLNDCGRPLVIL